MKAEHKNFLIALFFLSGTLLSSSTLFFDQTTPLRFLFLSAAILITLFALKPKTIRWDWISKSILIFFIWQCCSLFYAENKANTIPQILQTGILLVVILFSHEFKANNIFLKENILKSFVLIQTVWAVVGVLDYISYSENWRIPARDNYMIASMFANKNFYSSALMLMIPFNCIALFRLSRYWKWITLLILFLNIFMIINLQTRSVWIGSIFILVSGFAFIILKRKNSALVVKEFINEHKNIFVISGVFTLLLVVIQIKIMSSPAPKEKFILNDTEKQSLMLNSANERVFLWKQSAQMLKENIFIGVGAGNWKTNINKYGITGTVAEKGNVNFIEPHNDFIGIACETGIIGILMYYAFLSFLFFKIISINRQFYFLDLGVFMASLVIISFFIYSIFEFPKDRPEHLLIFFISILFLFSNENNLPERDIIALKHGQSLAFIFLSLSSFYYAGSVNANYHFTKIHEARFANNWSKVIQETGKSNIYSIDQNGIPISWYKGIAYFNLGNYQQANLCFLEAQKISPYNLHVLNNLASSYSAIGNNEMAKELYLKTLKISNTFDEARMNYCILLYNEGNHNFCKQELSKITDLNLIGKNADFMMNFVDSIEAKSIRTPQQIIDYLHR